MTAFLFTAANNWEEEVRKLLQVVPVTKGAQTALDGLHMVRWVQPLVRWASRHHLRIPREKIRQLQKAASIEAEVQRVQPMDEQDLHRCTHEKAPLDSGLASEWASGSALWSKCYK